MVGERIRQTRIGQERSLADVAGKAGISVATLSRVENNKQAVDVELFLRLAKILKVAAAKLLGDDGDSVGEPLATTLGRLSQAERTKVWRDLAAARRGSSDKRIGKVTAHIEELIAHIEFLQMELEAVRKRIRREPRKRARA